MAEDHESGPQFFYPYRKYQPIADRIKNLFYLKKYPYTKIPLTCNFYTPVSTSAKNTLTYTTVDNNRYLLQYVLLKNSLAIINVIRYNVYL